MHLTLCHMQQSVCNRNAQKVLHTVLSLTDMHLIKTSVLGSDVQAGQDWYYLARQLPVSHTAHVQSFSPDCICCVAEHHHPDVYKLLTCIGAGRV